MLQLADLALVLAVATAIAVAAERRAHRPVAEFFTAIIVADWIRRGLAAGPLSEPGPYAGLARGAFHLEQALFLFWPSGLALLGAIVFGAGGTTKRAIVAGYCLAVAALAARYPELRGAALGREYLALELVALAVSVALAVHWARRRERPELPQIVTMMLVGVSIAIVAGGPFAGDLFTQWPHAWPMHAVLYLAIVGVQGGGLWASRC